MPPKAWPRPWRCGVRTTGREQHRADLSSAQREHADAVLAAARPIAVDRPDAFLQAVAGALQGCREIGPGVVYRVAAQVQREFFDPPQFATGASGRTGKYR
jgi:hypothetical protein